MTLNQIKNAIEEDLGLPLNRIAPSIIGIETQELEDDSEYEDKYLLYVNSDLIKHESTIGLESFNNFTKEQKLVFVYLMYKYNAKMVENCLKVGSLFISIYPHMV